MIKCKQCKQDKDPYTDFYKQKINWVVYYRNICKDCYKQQRKLYLIKKG